MSLTSPEKPELFYSDKKRVILCLDGERIVSIFIFVLLFFLKRKKIGSQTGNDMAFQLKSISQ